MLHLRERCEKSVLEQPDKPSDSNANADADADTR